MKNKQTLELLSSAYTLSDMELFVFPELMYSIVIANIMSPVIWKWRDDPWFENIDDMPILKKIRRIKQFIMDNFVFNLDLDTWGLTTKEKEIARFESFIDMKVLKQSNALFGYEGDKYYFNVDIRRHFGLDKYTTNIIPYWKTETIEAMQAFLLKPGFRTGAGECVSLSSLYAAALFIIGKIPLDDIFIIGTPLHSQNFILYKEGILTNNRRIITKSMWFNSTETSTKARRALENEKISYVSHHSGYIHTIYKKATIDKEQYLRFEKKLRDFLSLNDFLYTIPKLPAKNKIFKQENSYAPIDINDSRNDILKKIKESYKYNNNSLLALHCYRDLSILDWEPFLKSAIERSPVSIEAVKNMTDIDVINYIKSMPANSIYSESRLAQPDEVWNYQTGDGIEKAVLCANILANRSDGTAPRRHGVTIKINHKKVELSFNNSVYTFNSTKALSKNICI